MKNAPIKLDRPSEKKEKSPVAKVVPPAAQVHQPTTPSPAKPVAPKAPSPVAVQKPTPPPVKAPVA